MKVELDVNQYMEMLKAFTEYSACKAKCYELEEENKRLKLILGNEHVGGYSEDVIMAKYMVVGSGFSLN